MILVWIFLICHGFSNISGWDVVDQAWVLMILVWAVLIWRSFRLCLAGMLLIWHGFCWFWFGFL